jgi:N-methylhydantoinase B
MTSGTFTAKQAAIDPITFEVIRHRLWAINNDQGRMAARLSGSTIVWELNDFNAALLTADGRGLCSGAYIMGHAATVESFIRLLLEQFSADEIHEGDIFFSNDPWCGALHANDGLVATPLFYGEVHVGWSCIVMHDTDVGSPMPGSMVVGSHDRFGESPLFPIIRLGEDFRPRPDLLDMLLRNSRIPTSIEQNMRARVAALRWSHGRVSELISEYGVDTFLAAQEALLEYVIRVLRRRIAELPDGEWYGETYHDHDSNSDRVYVLRCRMTKRGDHLTFDTTGTDGQADGPINCSRLALEGAILGSLLIGFCGDLPWAPGAVRQVFDLVAEGGTVNTATGSAAVSMGSMMAVLSSSNLAGSLIARMLQTSERYRAEAQATWSPGMSGAGFNLPDRNGQLTVSLAMDALGGGGGARTYADGVNSAGLLDSPATRITNVEVFESRGPLLQLFRREHPDSGGPGRFRGGAGLEFGIMAHKTGGPGAMATMGCGVAMPVGIGLSGGSPNGAASFAVVRGADVAQHFSVGHVPTTLEDLASGEIQRQAAKDLAFVTEGDVYVGGVAGGAGFGDPLRRDPAEVAEDVREGLVSVQGAQSGYAVVLASDGTADLGATEALRTEVRQTRLRESSVDHDQGGGIMNEARLLHPVSDGVEAVSTGDERSLRCTVCHYRYGKYTDDYKRGAAMREISLAQVSPLNAGCSEEYVLREFLCPNCATTVAVDVQHRDAPIRDEVRFLSKA